MQTMKRITLFYLLIISSLCLGQEYNYVLDTPPSEEFIANQLSKEHPRLFLTPERFKKIKEKLKKEPYKSHYLIIKKYADDALIAPPATRDLEGRRLLNVSRFIIGRITALALVYQIEKDIKYANRLENEILAVCDFEDWNPSHFLDVAEMSFGVSIGLDWGYNALSEATKKKAINALIKHAKFSLDSTHQDNWWIKGTNNWNQVCHGGLITAALMYYDINPKLATSIIKRAFHSMPYALDAYYPDGIYPEGASYWTYGTVYTLATIDVLKTALGNDYGLFNSPGLKESANFVTSSYGPLGIPFNFSDCGEKPRGAMVNFMLNYFVRELPGFNGSSENRILESLQEMSSFSRFTPLFFVWSLDQEYAKTSTISATYYGKGVNPLANIWLDADPTFYLGIKGGKATNNHGNMDAGSFVLDWKGTRWAMDLGSQDYTFLEATIGTKELWNKAQDGGRWKLLGKNNFGHSCLTVNNEMHLNEGFADLTDFKDSKESIEVQFDLTNLYSENTLKATRNLMVKKDASYLILKDELITNNNTNTIQWQWLTDKEVELKKNKAILKNGDQKLKIEIISHKKGTFKITSLDPPPLEYDEKHPNLKRLDFIIEKSDITQKDLVIEVKVSML